MTQSRFNLSLGNKQRRLPGQDPRPSQDQESLAVLRNKLLFLADEDAAEGARGPRRRRPGQSRALRELLDEARKQRLASAKLSTDQEVFVNKASQYLVNAIYPYCKNQDLVNEQMGYGETFVDLLLKTDRDRLVVVDPPRGSRRTESGRQVVALDSDGTPLSTFPPPGSSTQDKGPEIPPQSSVPDLAQNDMDRSG